MIIMITGCGKQNQVPGDTGKPVEEGTNAPVDSISEGEKQGQSNADSDTGSMEQEETVVYEISEEKLIVTYEGEKYTTMTMGVGGAYAFDGKAQVQESITNDKLPASGESVLGSGFMNDGRLCLAAQKEGLTFYYIPVEQAEK